MKLDGIHHITAITADAPGNVDFYTRVLGLRLVKKTVNQDDPTVYHLFYADEGGSPGADLTFFEYPGVPAGSPGASMIHTIVWRVASEEALDFWQERFAGEGAAAEREAGRLRFADPEGLGLELAVDGTGDEPLVAEHPEIPAELALLGFDGVRAYAADPRQSGRFLVESLRFEPDGAETFEARGPSRGGWIAYERSYERGRSGAGTVHHVAWSSPPEDHQAWGERAFRGGARPTPVIDRFYFRSIYFREPTGVLFEIATIGPGFAVDEAADRLGERLSLPPAFEHLRPQLEPVLTPLPAPRAPERVGRARR